MDDKIRSEFSRQAPRMASAPAFNLGPAVQRMVDVISPDPSALVLDLACGPGIVSAAAAPHFARLVGLDLTPDMLRLARLRFAESRLSNGDFLVGAASTLPFASASFSHVITRLSFHHFRDLPGILSELRRILRPSGTLLVADVVSSTDPAESALHNALEILRDPTHVRMFSTPELLDMLAAAGFHTLRQDSWQQPRSFAEWAAIIADPSRTAPLETVMRALARSGQHAGIDLREQEEELVFTHTWLLLLASSGYRVLRN